MPPSPVDDAEALGKLLLDLSEARKQLETIQAWLDLQLVVVLRKLIAPTGGAPRGTGSKGADQDSYSAVYVYVLAILGWIVIWEILALIQFLAAGNLLLFGSRGHWLAFLIPPQTVALLTLSWNAYVSFGHRKHSDYRTEAGIIELVEKNAGLFLVGSSALFAFASFAIGDLGLPVSFAGLMIYETLSLIFLSFVLLLYWIPDRADSRVLVRLRHFKSVPFTYAVSFFLAALMTVTTAALPEIGV